MILLRTLIPVAVTFAALLAGFFSILKAAAGEYLLSSQLIMLSMILDGIDGNLARLFKRTTKFGAELDTFVDMASFGIAPAALAYLIALKSYGMWGLLMATALVFSGAARLARFRVVDPFRGQKGYLGLPITVSGGWIALFVFVAESGFLDETVFALSHTPFATFVWSCTLGFTVLQVSHIHYSKPTKEPLFFVACVVFVVFLFLDLNVACISALGMLMWGFWYAFLSPFLPKDAVVLEESDEEETVSVRPSS